MQELISFQNRLLVSTPESWSRFLLARLPKNTPRLGITGLPGTGKTTLLLQYLRHFLRVDGQGLYVSADHPYFYTHSLLDLALHQERYGAKLLVIDNLQAYPNAEEELDIIQERCPSLQVVFAQSGGYRSQDASSFILPGLSFREYLEYQHDISFPVVTLSDICSDHLSITSLYLKDVKILPLFRKYLLEGYFPGPGPGPGSTSASGSSSSSSSSSSSVSTLQGLNQILDGVIGMQHRLDAKDLELIKRLLGEISTHLPYQPNISQLARQFFLGRQTITTYMKQMESAGLVHLMSKPGKGIQKPDKIYLDNLPFTHLCAPSHSEALEYETFLLNQVRYAGHTVTLTKDEQHFLIDNECVLEVVGKEKARYQHMESTQAYLAQNDIEHGFAQVIPLWLFGMLY